MGQTGWTTRRTLLVAGLGGLSLTVADRAWTQIPQAPPKSALLNTANLAPGSYLWHPELSPEGPVAMIVSLPDQLVHVYRNGIEIGVSTCSTGKPGHETPTGVFVILQKDRNHHSSTYNNAPMPNMERLTWSGIALHAGNLPGFPASHGCVRLPLEFSKLIFEITHLGIPVIIADEKSAPETVVHPGFVLPAEAEKQANEAVLNAAKNAHHAPDATIETDDVISIVISGADRNIIMFRDGAEFWRSAVEIRGDEALGNHVYKLLAADPDSTEVTWLAHRIEVADAGGASPHDVLSRIVILDWIPAVEALADLRPGSTLVVTDLSTGEETRSGPDFVIFRDEAGV